VTGNEDKLPEEATSKEVRGLEGNLEYAQDGAKMVAGRLDGRLAGRMEQRI
jgi:hypothetical protein